jgi:hypothetical protein
MVVLAVGEIRVVCDLSHWESRRPILSSIHVLVGEKAMRKAITDIYFGLGGVALAGVFFSAVLARALAG